MKTPVSPNLSRREFVRLSSLTAGAAVMASAGTTRGLGQVAGSDKIRVGIIGCGGRGRGAGKNVLDAAAGVEIVAVGDLFEQQAVRARDQFKVSADKTFWGFDAFQKVLATDVNYVILATPPGFRPSHFAAAVAAGKHIFIEKPVAVDPTGVRSIIATGKIATEKRLGVVAGTQRRHQASYIETMKRIKDGEMGELTGGQCYWNGDGIWFREKKDWLANLSDFEWQCWNWYHWDWMSGDQIVEQHIHNIDVMNWAFGGPPVKFYGMGGRQNRGSLPGNIWDHFAVEMDYANGARVSSMCRHAAKTATRIGERVVGTKGVAIPNNATITGEKPFNYTGPNKDPMVVEHTDLIASIRANNPLNETLQVAESTLTAIGARMAAYTGREVSWKWLMEGSKLDLFPANPGPGPGIFGPVAIPGTTPLV
jgi:predicted dehydrogenase